MYILNFKRHAEWYVILKHVLGGPLGRVLGGSLCVCVWGGGVICTLNSDFTNTFWATGIMNHEHVSENKVVAAGPYRMRHWGA